MVAWLGRLTVPFNQIIQNVQLLNILIIAFNTTFFGIYSGLLNIHNQE